MKDTEMQDIILQKYYDKRREGIIQLKPEDFTNEFSNQEICRISEQLEEKGLIEWKSTYEMGRVGNCGGKGKITASGIDVIEEGQK